MRRSIRCSRPGPSPGPGSVRNPPRRAACLRPARSQISCPRKRRNLQRVRRPRRAAPGIGSPSRLLRGNRDRGSRSFRSNRRRLRSYRDRRSALLPRIRCEFRIRNRCSIRSRRCSQEKIHKSLQEMPASVARTRIPRRSLPRVGRRPNATTRDLSWLGNDRYKKHHRSRNICNRPLPSQPPNFGRLCAPRLRHSPEARPSPTRARASVQP